MMFYAPCRKSGSFSPSRSLTYAFFQSERRPMYLPWRLNLPCLREVRTLSTFEPSSDSTAFLMSILLASIATWNTSVRPSSRRTVVFSVMSGRRSTCVSFMTLSRQLAAGSWQQSGSFCPLPAARCALSECLLQFLDRRARQDEPPRIDDVARAQPVARKDADALDVAHRQRQLVFRLHVDQQCLALDAEPAQHLHRSLRLDLRHAQRLDDGHLRGGQFLRQRRAQGALLDLLRQLIFVAPRLRAEPRAALAPQRVPDLADARGPRALRPPRLLAAAADHRAGLGAVRAAAVGRVGAHDRLVNQVGLHASAEHHVAQVDRADLLVLCVDDINSHDWSLPPAASYFLPFFFTGSTCATLIVFAATALRITTIAFGPPGTEPSTSTRLFSGSTRSTFRLRVVTPAAPMWPPIRMPLTTREG